MNNKILISKIEETIKRKPKDIVPYEELFSICRDIEKEDFKLAHDTNKKLRGMCLRSMNADGADVERLYRQYRNTLLFDAPHYFDSYMLYLEINRPPEERFYQPRRRIMKRVVDGLQDLVDDFLDELFLSMPPRVGKTTLLLMFATWLIGRNSERSNLYSAYSDVITKAFYNGVLEIITDPDTYLWSEIFPNAKFLKNGTDANNETIDLDRKKRYPSLTCRSLYGTLNGACDCNGILMADDLIGGIEEVLNPERMVATWGKVENNLLPRAKEIAKYLWCGTRWSVIDPIGMRLDTIENDKAFENVRYRVINLTALDENDESNFDYAYGVGFSTEYYQQRRASFERNNDMASWNAQYQQQPIEREGALFTPDGFRYYNGELPEGEPDGIYMAVDPAFGGGDFVSSPVGVQYGEDIYIPDVVFDNRDKQFTQPALARLAIRNAVKRMQIEANKSTEAYKEGVQTEVKKQGERITITSKAAPPTTSKMTRIFDKAPDIRERCIFLEPKYRNKEYNMFMQNVFSYKITGRNKNDDAPDSLAMLLDMITHPTNKVTAFRRPC